MTEKTLERTPEVGVRWHPYAEIFPWIEGPAFEELKSDIAKNGVLEPVVFLGDAILDGRNRYMAARALGIEYPRIEFDGDDPLGFVISHNLKRRHLSESQRAMVAAKLAKLPAHRPSDKSPDLGTSVADAAKSFNVGRGTVESAKVVQRDGTPELVHAVEAGKVSVSAAAEVAGLPKDEQSKIVAAGPKAVKEAAKQSRKARGKKQDAEGGDAGWKRQQEEIRAGFSPELMAAKDATAAAKAANRAKTDDAGLSDAERIEALEAEVIALENENAKLKGEIKTYERLELMYRDWTDGGWEKVIQAKDDTIAELQRTAQTRIARESGEKVRNLNAMRGLAKKLDEAGKGRDVYLDLDETTHG